MARKQRPVSSAASFYTEATPANTARQGQGRARQTTTSSLFPYSTARPLTGLSSQSFIPDVPSANITQRNKHTSETSQLETSYTETPLYARSDWNDEESPRIAQSPSAYSRSSYAGLTTAPPTTARARYNTLGDIREEDERSPSESELPYTAQGGGGEGWGGGDLVMSPEMLSAHSAGWTGRPQTNGSWFTTTTAAAKREQKQDEGPFADPPVTSKVGEPNRPNEARQSTLPSVLELEDLTGRQPNTPLDRHVKPSPMTPDSGGLDLMTPAAHQRLGRMSVAPARYHEVQDRDSDSSSRTEKEGIKLAETIKKTTGILRFYQVWNPFITPALLLISALLLTISLLNNPGPVSRYLILPADSFSNPPRGLVNVTLGLNGWCSLESSMNCEEYHKGDFMAKTSTYNVGEDSLLATLGDLITALCALAWLTTLYFLTHAFLHFFLFFSLNIPFTHLLDEAALLAPNGAPGKNTAQAEVDIRVRCEKPPFESMEWVWWAWWGHRRAPVGYIFAVITELLALSSFVVTFALKRSLGKELRNSDAIELGWVSDRVRLILRAGAFIPLLTALFTVGPVIRAAQWCWDIEYEWNTFLHPPEPTTAAIMLPIDSKPVAHVRNASGDSFFALRRTVAEGGRMTTHPDTQFQPELDEETRRWLAAYPTDPDLVNLIASLRKGQKNDDFILSDVGLLYVKPNQDETALLVPPKGHIRDELLQDAHEQDGDGHLNSQEMLESLQETFWWDTMEDDVRMYTERCFTCGPGAKQM